MFTSVSRQPFGVGSIRLSDGAVLRLKILIVDIKEMGFSPFGGTSFNVNVTGGVSVEPIQIVPGNSLRISRSSHRGPSSLGMAGSCSALLSRDPPRPWMLFRVRGASSRLGLWLKP
jgi:hypothetical protein